MGMFWVLPFIAQQQENFPSASQAGRIAAFLLSFIIEFGFSGFFTIYLLVVIIWQLFKFIKRVSRKDRRHFKKEVAASYKAQEETIRINIEKEKARASRQRDVFETWEQNEEDDY
ncbi:MULTISPECIES: hypothetical protein [Enterococcus]|uniref:DUF3899 domain-containing protein n=1 Tax=Candidatus Enterococcus mangumiae TaxID=2230878 RepID=A0ABZ2SZ65_9ENTE|nr:MULTISPECIES: hypothetical protein [unclassified Enterococcus]MBO0462244.1 hypothetical protein [Enterococcus sp. DIV1298c]MBO0489014.1 hypothetical protein [Enterococcus sp. DIV1094]MBO1299179.1 hypothetical protein [Enterococcus sp. DIV1271a]